MVYYEARTQDLIMDPGTAIMIIIRTSTNPIGLIHYNNTASPIVLQLRGRAGFTSVPWTRGRAGGRSVEIMLSSSRMRMVMEVDEVF